MVKKIMYKIAIVENEIDQATSLKDALDEYQKKTHNSFQIDIFLNSYQYLESKDAYSFDIAFLDILMPGLNGMDLAKEIRKHDSDLDIIFVTNMSNYAINGYEVSAYDFILKPFNKEHLFKTLDNLLTSRDLRKKRYITLKSKDGVEVVSLDDIIYVDISAHLISYHLSDDKVINKWGNLSEEQALLGDSFIKPNQYTLINIKRIRSIKGDMISLLNKEIPISRKYKKEVNDALLSYYSRV